MGEITVRRQRWARCSLVAACLLGLTGLGAPQSARAGYASIVVDENSGEVLNEVNADQVNHPASLTKMMTLYLVFDALRAGKLHWDQPLRVSQFAADKSATKLGLEPGSSITVRDCVLGMIVLSANDAATVAAEALGGTESGFAGLMTAKARQLGMISTSYVNASGLPDEDQVTTARDLVKLAMALHREFPDDYHFFSTRQFLFHGRTIAGHNRLMYRYPGMDGLKTGFTVSSGFNLASSAVQNDDRLFGIVLGSQSAPARDQLMATLLDNGFARRQTDPQLVALAGGERLHGARQILAHAEHVVAALNPISRAEASPLPPRAHIVPAAATGRWSVQIGAYGHAAQATQAAQEAGRLIGAKSSEAGVRSPSKGERYYRARLQGFASEHEAHDACHKLEHKGHDCMVMPPDGVRLAGTAG